MQRHQPEQGGCGEKSAVSDRRERDDCGLELNAHLQTKRDASTNADMRAPKQGGIKRRQYNTIHYTELLYYRAVPRTAI